MFSMDEMTRLLLLFGALFLLAQLIAVLAGRLDKESLLESVREMNSNAATLDVLEAQYNQSQETIKLLIQGMNAAVDFLGKSIPSDGSLGFVGDLSKEVDKLLDQVTDGKPNTPIAPPITIITEPDVKPDGEALG